MGLIILAGLVFGVLSIFLLAYLIVFTVVPGSVSLAITLGQTLGLVDDRPLYRRPPVWALAALYVGSGLILLL